MPGRPLGRRKDLQGLCVAPGEHSHVGPWRGTAGAACRSAALVSTGEHHGLAASAGSPGGRTGKSRGRDLLSLRGHM